MIYYPNKGALLVVGLPHFKKGVVMIYISKHPPTDAQQELVLAYFKDKLEQEQMIWQIKGADQQLRDIGCKPRDIVAGVFPPAVLCVLLNAGYRTLVFANCPEARERHRFKCAGASLLELMPHKIDINWLDTVIPLEKQSWVTTRPIN